MVLPPGAPQDFYAQLIRIVQSSGAKAILDTRGEALRYGVQAEPYLIKPNDTEAQQLTGLPVEGLEAIAVVAYPLDPVGRKLMFGARKGVTATVVSWFFAHLEHHLGKAKKNLLEGRRRSLEQCG